MTTTTIAILARTNRALRLPEEILSREGIKYFLLGGSGYWNTPEIRATIAYLTCVLYPLDWAIGGAVRSPFWPSKFLPKSRITTRLKELREADETPSTQAYFSYLVRSPEALVENKNLKSLSEFTQFIHSLSRYKNLSAQEAVKSVFGALRVGDTFSEADEIDNSPLENLADLLKLSARHSDLKSFLDYCRRASAASKGRKGICLATCHSAKGTEYHTVYLIGCQEGLFPHAKADDLQGESNTFFVGCSRAERQLVITYAGQPSIYLKGIAHETSNPSPQGS